ncbi:DUF58 domain-containing protein [Halorussus litoreus]|uniref:DUF58 domain-containing protein n=1 Tax=Halorussus litoreus TaxID=1710536 RepID=UPI0013002FFC|nr:DUF58 domain-containing protein [Halorussus litoreus]
MGVTRGYWGEAGLVVALVAAAVAFARPSLLVGAAGVAGWLLARQYAFVRDVSAVAADLSVDQSVARDAVRVGDEVRVVLDAELPDPAPVDLAIEANPPVGVELVESGGEVAESGGEVDQAGDSSGTRAALSVGQRTATTAFAVRPRLAGAFESDPATATASDPAGRFRIRFPAGHPLELTATPRGPTNVHVGVGGETADAPYGEYASDERGPGIELADIRAYVPGDEVQRIDWNATARLGEPHVREFETTTERRTVLLLDCRASMADGPAGETKFDYVRQVALAVVRHARERGDPVALYAVGEAGLLVDQPPTTTEEGYAKLERHLRALEPDSADERAGSADWRAGGNDGAGQNAGTHSPAVARRRAARLRGDDSAFADRLRPFFADADPYVERVTADPLYRTAGTRLDRLRGAVTAVVLTDDARPTETREVTKIARRRDDHVVAFLTPGALFDREVDLDTAYDRYADFERFRRGIGNLDRVRAYEVGPGDRLDALLAVNRTRPRPRAEAGE